MQTKKEKMEVAKECTPSQHRKILALAKDWGKGGPGTISRLERHNRVCYVAIQTSYELIVLFSVGVRGAVQEVKV